MEDKSTGNLPVRRILLVSRKYEESNQRFSITSTFACGYSPVMSHSDNKNVYSMQNFSRVSGSNN